MITPEDLMRMAIDKCREGVAAGQSPFGCAIAREGEVLAAAHNVVWMTQDITAHAEINALRQACKATGNIHLEGAMVATTCEPCPMCMAALHWARVETVYFGATIADAERIGFNELQLSGSDLLRLGGSNVKLVPGLLTRECCDVMEEWKRVSGRSY